MNILSKLFIACTAILCIASCKKKEDDANTKTPTSAGPDCRMRSFVHRYNGCKDSTIILGSSLDRITGHLRFNNCASGTPGQIIISGKTFVYDGSKVYVVDTSAMADRDTLIVDVSSQRILEVRRSHPLLTGQMATRYEYAPDGKLQRSITSYDSVPYDTALYTYSNGDIVMQVNTQMGHPDTFRYNYYTDKPVPANGYITQPGLRYGSAFIFKSTHLMKGVTDAQGMQTSLYSYETDSYGNITRVIRSDPRVTMSEDTTIYRYACAVE